MGKDPCISSLCQPYSASFGIGVSLAKKTAANQAVVSVFYSLHPISYSLSLCYNYVMRSTRNVVNPETDLEMGHYSDPPLLVLASLASGPKHGHAMIEDIVRLCGTRLGPGTLYGAISRLEQQRWIAPLPAEERRQPYRITAEGLRILRAKLTTLQQFSKAGLKRLEAL
jgi:DNA-binding PadR family transcriptional regulator